MTNDDAEAVFRFVLNSIHQMRIKLDRLEDMVRQAKKPHAVLDALSEVNGVHKEPNKPGPSKVVDEYLNGLNQGDKFTVSNVVESVEHYLDRATVYSIVMAKVGNGSLTRVHKGTIKGDPSIYEKC